MCWGVEIIHKWEIMQVGEIARTRMGPSRVGGIVRKVENSTTSLIEYLRPPWGTLCVAESNDSRERVLV